MIPDELRQLLDAHEYGVLATINPDGSPQSSVIWATYDDEAVIFSTIRGRRKTRNLERDPRASLCVYQRSDPNRYVEVRGVVSLTEEGGPELIERLSHAYDGQTFTEGNPANVRVVARLTPTRVIVY